MTTEAEGHRPEHRRRGDRHRRDGPLDADPRLPRRPEPDRPAHVDRAPRDHDRDPEPRPHLPRHGGRDLADHGPLRAPGAADQLGRPAPHAPRARLLRRGGVRREPRRARARRGGVVRLRRAPPLRPGRRGLRGLDLGRARGRLDARAHDRRRDGEGDRRCGARGRRPAEEEMLGAVGVVRQTLDPDGPRLRPRRALARPCHRRRAGPRSASACAWTGSRTASCSTSRRRSRSRPRPSPSRARRRIRRRMAACPSRSSPSRQSSSSSCCCSPSAIRVAREYERGVIFRLGRLKSPPKGPGLFLLIPIIDKMVKVDLRTVTLNVPPQEVITSDNVPVRVNAVAYFRIIDPEKAIVQVENYMVATSQIAQTTLRNVLGQHMLDELLVGARQDQRDPPADHRRGHLAVGHQGLDRRGEGRRDPERDAARHGPPGRGRARAAREGDRRRGRVPGLRRSSARRPT